MKLKAGTIFGKKDCDDGDAIWEMDSPQSTVDVLDKEGVLVLRINPDDLIAICDAIDRFRKRNKQ